VQGEDFEKATQALVDMDSSDATQMGTIRPRQRNGAFEQR
jgi:hypothetical protein